MAQDDPKLSAQELNDSLKDIGVVVSEQTVKRTLNKNNLYGRRSRCKPLRKNKHKGILLDWNSLKNMFILQIHFGMMYYLQTRLRSNYNSLKIHNRIMCGEEVMMHSEKSA